MRLRAQCWCCAPARPWPQGKLLRLAGFGFGTGGPGQRGSALVPRGDVWIASNTWPRSVIRANAHQTLPQRWAALTEAHGRGMWTITCLPWLSLRVCVTK